MYMSKACNRKWWIMYIWKNCLFKWKIEINRKVDNYSNLRISSAWNKMYYMILKFVFFSSTIVLKKKKYPYNYSCFQFDVHMWHVIISLTTITVDDYYDDD
jgi:hypothetical protein